MCCSIDAEETNQRLKAKIEKIKEDVANLSEQVGLGDFQAWLWLAGGKVKEGTDPAAPSHCRVHSLFSLSTFETVQKR